MKPTLDLLLNLVCDLDTKLASLTRTVSDSGEVLLQDRRCQSLNRIRAESSFEDVLLEQEMHTLTPLVRSLFDRSELEGVLVFPFARIVHDRRSR
jgi:hypothetical protein